MIKTQCDYFASQNRIDQFETPTASYTLFGAGITTKYESKKTAFDFYFLVNNLTNQVYYNHLSRLKYVGIAGMGRNIMIGLSVPFGLLNP